VSNVLILFIS